MKKGLARTALFLLMFLFLPGCTPVRQEAPYPTETTPAPVAPEETTDVTESISEPLATDRYHLKYDSPDNYRLDITIPLLREDLPGAEGINAQIGKDYASYLDKSLEEFSEMEWGFSYPMVHISYEEYVFGDLLELVVRYNAYSLYGSGPASLNTVYCYDLKQEKVSSLSQLMEQLEISEEDVVTAYLDYYGLDEAERDQISLEETLVGQFYLDGEGTVRMEANQ